MSRAQYQFILNLLHKYGIEYISQSHSMKMALRVQHKNGNATFLPPSKCDLYSIYIFRSHLHILPFPTSLFYSFYFLLAFGLFFIA